MSCNPARRAREGHLVREMSARRTMDASPMLGITSACSTEPWPAVRAEGPAGQAPLITSRCSTRSDTWRLYLVGDEVETLLVEGGADSSVCAPERYRDASGPRVPRPGLLRGCSTSARADARIGAERRRRSAFGLSSASLGSRWAAQDAQLPAPLRASVDISFSFPSSKGRPSTCFSRGDGASTVPQIVCASRTNLACTRFVASYTLPPHRRCSRRDQWRWPLYWPLVEDKVAEVPTATAPDRSEPRGSTTIALS